jgi:hypothetical protein
VTTTILGINFLVAVFFSLLVNLWGVQHASAFSVGATYAFFVLSFWVIVWSLKKSIALVLMIIVSKYAIFAVSLYWLVNSLKINLFWFIAGTMTILPTAVILSLKEAGQCHSAGHH